MSRGVRRPRAKARHAGLRPNVIYREKGVSEGGNGGWMGEVCRGNAYQISERI